MSRADKIRLHYEHRIDPARASFDVLDWASAASQNRRFEVLVENVDLNGRSLVDIGCGLGDLWGYLKLRDIDVDYTGVDILKKMVEEARQRHPDARFEWRNVFEPQHGSDDSFDVTFASGIFNLNLGNNLDFLTAAIPRMMQMARRQVVFNLLHIRREYEPHRYFYCDPEQIKALILPHGWDVRIIDTYLPNDFTVICNRP